MTLYDNLILITSVPHSNSLHSLHLYCRSRILLRCVAFVNEAPFQLTRQTSNSETLNVAERSRGGWPK